MNTPTDTQKAKLPKWALEYITRCERQRENAETELKDYLDRQSESLVYIQRGIGDKCYLQSDRVTFVLPLGEVTVALQKGILECNANYGAARFMVRPWSSNVAHLEIVREVTQ